jgi:hypothetical protein
MSRSELFSVGHWADASSIVEFPAGEISGRLVCKKSAN